MFAVKFLAHCPVHCKCLVITSYIYMLIKREEERRERGGKKGGGGERLSNEIKWETNLLF